MNTERIPAVPQWRYKSGYIVTPDGGLLYTGTCTINYISKINHEDETNNSVKILYSKHIVKRIDCDLSWDKNKYFACLSYDDTIFIWDLDEEKIIMGHKVHTKTVETDKIASETVCISFARNKKLLSIDTKALISFCLLSNTYIKKNRIISHKHFVTALKCSPYKENIFAAGTSRGLVMLVDMEAEQVLHTVSGHTIEITTLSWCKDCPLPEVKSPEVSSDDIFDIYQVPDNEEFGVIRQKEVPSSDDDNFSVEKERPISRNENFNFVEACKDLKDQILANKASHDSSFEIKTEQNNGADKACDDASLLENYATQSAGLENYTAQSAGANTLSVSIESCSDPPSDNKSMVSGSDGLDDGNATYFLASGSRDFVVCVWKITDLVESIAMPVNKLKTKKLLSAANSKGHYCMVSWLDNNVLATNCRNGGCLTFTPLRANDNISFKRWKVFEEFTCLSPIPNSNLLWLIHPSKKIICYDVKNSKDLLEFTCISSNIATMKEVPVDMHTIAIACPDRRVAFLNSSSISRKCVKFDQFSRQIHSSVLSLSSCPTNGYNLAFGTDEGRVGIINLTQPKSNPTLLKPFSGKPVYSIDWLYEDYVLVCSDNKVGAYKFCDPSKDPKIIKNISSPSTISARGNSLIVGKQNGNLALYIKKDDDEIDFEQITEVSIGSKYVSEISWNSVNKQIFAACSFSNKLSVIKFVNHKQWEVVRTYNMNESVSGAVCIRWSNKNVHLLLCSGLDGVIRLFDTSLESEDPIYLKQFIFPVSCTIFSPVDDKILICSGKGTTVEFLNIADNLGAKFCKQTYKKMRDKPPETGWASQIMFVSKGSRQRSSKIELEPAHHQLGHESDNSIAETLENIKISSQVVDEELMKPSFEIPKKQVTIFHLLAKEMNKNPLENTLKVLKMNSQDSGPPHFKNMFTQKLFGTAKEVEEILQIELRNYHLSNTKTIGQIIIPQIRGTLKEDIIEKIKTKKLTEHHVSLAPTISYEFWKQCCVAYANQLIEVRLPLQALPYLLALHDIKQSIETLIKSNYYREAWVVAKIHLQDDDPTLDNILQKWIEHMDMNGNLDGAVLLCTISEKYNLAQTILEKRREHNEQVVEILELLREKCEK